MLNKFYSESLHLQQNRGVILFVRNVCDRLNASCYYNSIAEQPRMILSATLQIMPAK